MQRDAAQVLRGQWPGMGIVAVHPFVEVVPSLPGSKLATNFFLV